MPLLMLLAGCCSLKPGHEPSSNKATHLISMLATQTTARAAIAPGAASVVPLPQSAQPMNAVRGMLRTTLCLKGTLHYVRCSPKSQLLGLKPNTRPASCVGWALSKRRTAHLLLAKLDELLLQCYRFALGLGTLKQHRGVCLQLLHACGRCGMWCSTCAQTWAKVSGWFSDAACRCKYDTSCCRSNWRRRVSGTCMAW